MDNKLTLTYPAASSKLGEIPVAEIETESYHLMLIGDNKDGTVHFYVKHIWSEVGYMKIELYDAGEDVSSKTNLRLTIYTKPNTNAVFMNVDNNDGTASEKLTFWLKNGGNGIDEPVENITLIEQHSRRAAEETEKDTSFAAQQAEESSAPEETAEDSSSAITSAEDSAESSSTVSKAAARTEVSSAAGGQGGSFRSAGLTAALLLLAAAVIAAAVCVIMRRRKRKDDNRYPAFPPIDKNTILPVYPFSISKQTNTIVKNNWYSILLEKNKDLTVQTSKRKTHELMLMGISTILGFDDENEPVIAELYISGMKGNNSYTTYIYDRQQNKISTFLREALGKDKNDDNKTLAKELIEMTAKDGYNSTKILSSISKEIDRAGSISEDVLYFMVKLRGCLISGSSTEREIGIISDMLRQAAVPEEKEEPVVQLEPEPVPVIKPAARKQYETANEVIEKREPQLVGYANLSMTSRLNNGKDQITLDLTSNMNDAVFLVNDKGVTVNPIILPHISKQSIRDKIGVVFDIDNDTKPLRIISADYVRHDDMIKITKRGTIT